jgi:hypothetical protein
MMKLTHGFCSVVETLLTAGTDSLGVSVLGPLVLLFGELDSDQRFEVVVVDLVLFRGGADGVEL